MKDVYHTFYTPYDDRTLTYLDEDDDNAPVNEYSSTFLLIGFAVLAFLFCIMAILTIRLTLICREFYEWNAVRLIFPGICWILALQCGTFAYKFSDRGDGSVKEAWAICLYMLQATVAPGLFLSTFVVTFLAHRTRSIPFCTVYRGTSAGQRHNFSAGGINELHGEEDEMTQALIRPATLVVMTRLFAMALLILSLFVNFDVVWENDGDLAGRTGWLTVGSEPWGPESVHILLSLFPMAVVAVACMYFSMLLWRYGTQFSMIIYPSMFNPWLSTVVGIGFLSVGQFFGPELFPVLSHTGILVYVMSFVRTLYEVREDFEAANQLGCFLDVLGNDKVTQAVIPTSVILGERQSFSTAKGKE
jgi:hypothetical protein